MSVTKTRFIATYDDYFATGTTLENAFQNLKDNDDAVPIDEVTFYEVEKLEVEVKIVKKEVVSKISKKQEECK